MSKNSAAWRSRRKELTEAVLTLYTKSASDAELDKAFKCFHPQVVFQDPISRIQGQEKYQAQFRSLKAIFKDYKPLTVEMTGDYDKISIDTTCRWVTRWMTLDLRQVTICHVSDGGLGVITRHEDLWSWADVWLQMPVISFFYSRWRPWFGVYSSAAILKKAEKDGEKWVGEAKRMANQTYQLPQQPADNGQDTDNDDSEGGVPKVYQGGERSTTRVGTSSQSR